MNLYRFAFTVTRTIGTRSKNLIRFFEAVDTDAALVVVAAIITEEETGPGVVINEKLFVIGTEISIP